MAKRTTFRFRIPVARAGGRLSFVFFAGDDALRIHAATVARAGANGALAAAPLPLTFQGAPDALIAARQAVHSDAVALPVSFREELAISFEVEGAIAEGQMDLFPQSYAAEGSHSSKPGRFGEAQNRLVGLGGIEVDAKETRTIALIGGGFAAGKGAPTGDFRETWPAVAERLLGQPVLNLSQEGQSIASVVAALDAGTLRLAGVTDCLVLLGGDEAPSVNTSTLLSSLDALLSRLRSRCHVYAGTLPPQGPSSSSGEPSRGARHVVNDWLRSAPPAAQVVDFDVLLRDPSNPERCQPHVQDDTGGFSERAQAWMGAEVARRLGPEPSEEPSRKMTLKVTLTNSSHEVLTVDTAGTVFAVKRETGRALLWASTDNARSWQPRGRHPQGSSFQVMTSLKDGTLLADTLAPDGMHALARSTDNGATWSDVLPLGLFRMLQPGNIRELHGTVFFGEYQVFANESPIRIWASTDGGATWKVRATLTGRRHCHSLVADAEQGVLWAMMGDARGGLLRSVDDGVTWSAVVDGPRGVAVDGIITPPGLLFGSDTLYGPDFPSIRLVGANDEMMEMTRLPGPSYSVLRLRGGGFLMGTTRETGGDVYAPGDESAHVFISADGRTWTEFMAYPRLLPDDYARADVYWQLPSGEVLLRLTNVQGIGTGFQLLESTLL
ncbi:hypothetical protein QEG98_08410 [Myxococcus sp. MxC21-1]|uniref:hypothetical protein n=1 Tax=Myxococcus sp. MxC21-1 TaxID=3041439 RepID=UPI00292E3F5F|nr:hypothetical protein [Myxococcus sp. MxC21-1]WNZ63710.1 hypothetical protein QEG98_08410 [Myxococcus sp. MxC21-1]